MPFATDSKLDSRAAKWSHVYGKYVISFYSDNGQVEAHLFEQGGQLLAHVSPVGVDISDVTDPYVEEIERFAKEHGFEGRLRFLHYER